MYIPPRFAYVLVLRERMFGRLIFDKRDIFEIREKIRCNAFLNFPEYKT